MGCGASVGTASPKPKTLKSTYKSKLSRSMTKY